MLDEADVTGQIIAFGVNCTNPRYINQLIEIFKKANSENKTKREIIIYPNSGEIWDKKNK